MDKKLNFKIGSYIFIASHGVGTVVEMVTETYSDVEMVLYKVKFEKDNLEMLIPVSRLRDVGARILVDKKTATWIFSTVLTKAPKTSKGGSWTTRMLEASTKVDSGSTVLIAEVVRDLHISANDPNKSYLEKSIYEKAVGYLIDEVSKVLSVTKDEVYKRIIDALGNAITLVAKDKNKVAEDDFSEEDEMEEVYKEEDSFEEDEDSEEDSKKRSKKKTA